MSNRACYIFRDQDNTFTVFKHYDGHPEGAAEALSRAPTKAWPLPRYEADDFAAAFVAANKSGGGDIRLSLGAEHHGDIEYVYEVMQAENGQLIVSAWNAETWETVRKNPASKKAKPFFYGRLKDFVNENGAIWPDTKPSLD